jgi:hypothetical protein
MTDDKMRALLQQLNDPESQAAEWFKSIPALGYKFAEETTSAIPEASGLAFWLDLRLVAGQ